MTVVLVAVKKVKILEYVAVVEQAGLEALVVDLDAFAIQNQYELNHPQSSEEAVALIDIGASVMKTNVVRDGASIFARDVPFGGHHYTQAIAQRLDISFEKAEAAKQGQDVGVSWDDLVPALEAVSRDLSLEVQRTFDYFASTAESERIGRIVLSGGCARLAGIDEFLSSTWGVPVEIARPLERVGQEAGQFSAEDLEQAGPLLAVGVGLGLRQAGGQERMIRINLAPPSAKKAFAVPDFNLGMLFGVLALGLVLILGGWWWSVSAEIRRLNNEIAENKKQAEQLKVVIAESQRFQRDKEALERRVNAIEVVARQATRPVYLLDAVADQLPKDLWLNRMEEKGTQLKFAGTTYSATSLSDFMSNLKASGKFRDVDIVDAKQDLTKSPRLITFEVVARFEP
jgi:type IV pilus assembly protein PilM